MPNLWMQGSPPICPLITWNGKVEVYLDDRLVPHIFAEDETDAYFVQGYLHAKFRLWQMEPSRWWLQAVPAKYWEN